MKSKLTFTSITEGRTTENITVAGVIIGKIYDYRGERTVDCYHAALETHRSDQGWLFQGHGTTKEEAIKNAILAGDHQISMLTADVARLKELLSEEG